MPVWTVQVADSKEERVEAGMLATESGALVALSQQGLLLRAWAPGQWQAVHVDDVEEHRAEWADEDAEVLVGSARD
jgi:muconolactone delta-isomerase